MAIDKKRIRDSFKEEMALDMLGDANPFESGEDVITELDPPDLIADIEAKDAARKRADMQKGRMFTMPDVDNISSIIRGMGKKEGDFIEVPVKLARTKKTRLY